MRTVDLATAVVKELVQRTEIPQKEITLCVYGQVVPTLDWLNIAREVVLRAGLPRSIEAYAVSRACATSAAEACGPSSMRAGSPGSTSASAKAIVVTPRTTTAAQARRRR